MNRNRIAVSLLVILAAVAAQAQSGAQQSFNSIKSLAGSWEGKNQMGDPVQVSFAAQRRIRPFCRKSSAG